MKKLLPALIGILYVFVTQAQNSPAGAGQVVKWNFSAKKIADKTYEVTMTAAVQSPWHIYSQTTPDGGPLPTKITYSKNPLITIEGAAKESGKVITKHEEVFGVDVIYFDGNVIFTQTVKLKTNAKTNLSGRFEYMVCNDAQCLPPTTVNFSVPLQ